jgi:hypothetical protein
MKFDCLLKQIKNYLSLLKSKKFKILAKKYFYLVEL